MKAGEGLIIFLLLIFCLFSPALAQEKSEYLRDVPEGHYAYDAVYDLVKQGVIGGFPDGTFRGKNDISRYEMAAFMSKLAASIEEKRGVNEKMLAELKNETARLQYQADRANQETKITGDLQLRWRRGITQTVSGTQVDYRLITTLTKDFGGLASLKLNLDTMDAGYDNAQRDLVQMLDFEGKVKLGGAVLKITDGPGDVSHVDTGLFPAENGLKYQRLKRTIGLSAKINKTDLGLDYIVRSYDYSGLINTAEVSAKWTQYYPAFSLTLNPRIFFNRADQRDIRLEASGSFKLPAKFLTTLLIGAAKNSDYPHGLYLKWDLSAGDNFRLLAQRLGAQYREKFSYNIFDIFDRSLADGSTNFGLSLKQPFWEAWFGAVRADYTDPGAVTTGELQVGKMIDPNSSLALYYQAYKAGSTAQAYGLIGRIKI
ncbi:MAG: S-layer homology domain-containing protein [Candidatus Margulisbacteria bacterium]|nr:S-layer homology domain-containing protein [Candidatus Margulisiibacteriota bacterium]